jgi:two-component system sensor histidine kinase CssS
MKRWPLWVQIWGAFVGITLVVMLLIALLLPSLLNRFFTAEIFAVIQSAQQNLLSTPMADRLEEPFTESGRTPPNPDARTVRHILVDQDGQIWQLQGGQLFMPRLGGPRGNGNGARPGPFRDVPRVFLEHVSQQALVQTEETQQYKEPFDGENMFYVIRRTQLLERDMYLVSYMRDTYRQNLVTTLNRQFGLLMLIVMLLSVLPSIWMARYLSRPLVQLDRSVTQIADRHWHDPITVNRSDEIGRLAASIDRMRIRLKAQDEAQQAMLQNVSHELKTPVMVIQSYAQSIRDGVYPQGDLEASVDVIQGEAERLEKRIRDLLYMTKLQYLAGQPMKTVSFDLHEVIDSAVRRLRTKAPELAWDVQLEPVTLVGDRDQWLAAFENVLDNATRYARNEIKITLHQQVVGQEQGAAQLSVFNDGPPIAAEAMERLFDPFAKGPDGQFGLGLAIARRIADMHGVSIRFTNVEGGVLFEWVWEK